MDSKICFEMSVFVVEAMRTLCASFMIVKFFNGLGDIWWTDKCMYFSSIDGSTFFSIVTLQMHIYDATKQFP